MDGVALAEGPGVRVDGCTAGFVEVAELVCVAVSTGTPVLVGPVVADGDAPTGEVAVVLGAVVTVARGVWVGSAVSVGVGDAD